MQNKRFCSKQESWMRSQWVVTVTNNKKKKPTGSGTSSEKSTVSQLAGCLYFLNNHWALETILCYSGPLTQTHTLTHTPTHHQSTCLHFLLHDITRQGFDPTSRLVGRGRIADQVQRSQRCAKRWHQCVELSQWLRDAWVTQKRHPIYTHTHTHTRPSLQQMQHGMWPLHSYQLISCREH